MTSIFFERLYIISWDLLHVARHVEQWAKRKLKNILNRQTRHISEPWHCETLFAQDEELCTNPVITVGQHKRLDNKRFRQRTTNVLLALHFDSDSCLKLSTKARGARP